MSGFVRISGTQLYLADAVTLQTARSAYLLPAGTTAPDQFSLQDALTTYSGYFIFANALPQQSETLATFIAAAQQYLANPGRAGVRFAFFNSTAVSGLQATIVRAKVAGTSLTTSDRVDFVMQNFTLRLLGQNVVSQNANGDGLLFTPPSGKSNLFLASPLGTGPQAQFPLQCALTLSLMRAQVDGCMAFDVNADQSGLANLDAGLRYFVSSAESPGYVDTMRYPIFDLTAPNGNGNPTRINLWTLLDTLDPLNAARTRFAICPSSNPSALRTYLRNPLGAAMLAKPSQTSAFVFSTVLTYAPASGETGAPGQPMYLAPAGDFALTLESTAPSGTYANNLMCGLSGVEYITLANGGANTLSFHPGNAAFAPARYTFDKKGAIAAVSFDALTKDASTSYVSLSGSEPVTYYAQPESSIVHALPDKIAAGATAFLPYLAMKAGAPDDAFPLAPYAGAQFASPAVARALEYQLLSPTRRGKIPPVAPSLRAADAPQQGTTPQGLLLNLNGTDWQTLTLARSMQGDPSAAVVNDLRLFSVKGALRDALQSNQLFLVITDPQAFLANCEIPYTVTQQVLDALRLTNNIPADVAAKLAPLAGKSYQSAAAYRTDILACLSPYLLETDSQQRLQGAGVPAAVTEKLGALIGTSYGTIAAFNAALQGALTPAEFTAWAGTITEYAAFGYYTYQKNAVSYGDAIVGGAADFSLWSDGFQFDLSPYQWSRFGTILVMKFMNKPLRELVGDVQSWSHANDFNQGNPSAAQQQLQRVLDSANANSPDLRYFVETVAGDAGWNGIVAFSARVPLSGLPQQLEGLAAGIDPARFTAHHAGVNVTPVNVTESGPLLAPSSLFGLIDYEDPAHIADTSSDYQYKVLWLKVLILNTAVADFSSRVELLANRLFGDLSTLQGSSIGNVIDFDGVYQRHGDQGSYLFTNTQRNAFTMSSQVLNQVVVSRAQFVTLSPSKNSNAEDVKTKFLFTGTIAFKNFSQFDVFSFGNSSGSGLAYSNLAIDMDFNIDIPSYKTFGFDVSGVALDLSSSAVRTGSVYNHFPLKLTTLAQGSSSNRPDKANFMPVGTPLASGGLTDTWFALQFSLNLGTPGALAAATGFTAGFVAAWSPATSQPSLFIGLSLPGVKGGERAISIEGVLKLNFGDIAFIASGTSYILELKNISLGLLSLSFPPNGQTSILLFGDPSGKDRETLAWYAAYVKNDSSQPHQQQQMQRLLPGVDAALTQLGGSDGHLNTL